jgi:hypothetical protein
VADGARAVGGELEQPMHDSMPDALVATEPLYLVADAFRTLMDRSRPLRFDVGGLNLSLPQRPLDVIVLRSLLLHPSPGHTVRAWSGSGRELGQPDHARFPRAVPV